MPITGTDLGDISTDTSAGAGDAGKIVLLDGSGQIDSSMLPAPSSGDITAVTAGTGLTGGGTSGSVTLAVAYGSSASTAAEGNDSRLSDDRTASGLRSASTVVAVSSATAPSAGQLLVATASNAAEWKSLGASGAGYILYFASDGGVTGGTDGSCAFIAPSATNAGGVWLKTGSSWVKILTFRDASQQIKVDGSTLPASGGANVNFISGTGVTLTAGTDSGGTRSTITIDAAGGSGDITEVVAGTGLTGGATSGSATLAVDFGTGSGEVCEGNDSRLSDDRTASGIRTASTVVAVSSATAPTSGQVLQASSSTAASWVTPASASTTIKKAGTTIGTRGAVNFIEGSNVTITTTDNSGSDRVDVTIASSGSGSSFAILTDINPYNLWDADHVATTSGSVDTITDQGTGGKNFSASGSNRCTVGTDGAGKNYLAPDGTDDYYTAGAAADWKWIHDGTTPWTIGCVWDLTGISATKQFLDTSDAATNNVGINIAAAYSSSTNYGIDFFMSRGSAPLFQAYNTMPAMSGIITWSIRYTGEQLNTRGGTVMEIEVWMGGRRMGTCLRASAPSSSNPTGTLTLFRRTSTTGSFFTGKLYQLWTVKKAVPERIMQSWAADVATRYNSNG